MTSNTIVLFKGMHGLTAARMNTSALTVALVVVMSKLTNFMSVGLGFFGFNVLGRLLCIFFECCCKYLLDVLNINIYVAV